MARGRRGKELTEYQRGRIAAALYDMGCTVRDISAQEGIAKSTVHDTVVRLKRTGSPASRPRRGRPRKLNEEDELYILRRITSGECTSVNQIRADLRDTMNISISQDPVRRALRRHSFHPFKVASKPQLTEESKRQRREWVSNHSFSRGKHRNILFTDESCIYSSKKHNNRYFWRRSGEDFTSRSVEEVKQGGGVHVKILASFSYYGAGTLVRLPQGLDADLMANIIEEDIMLDAKLAFGRKKWSLLMDNCSVHTSKKVGETLERLHVDWLRIPPLQP